MFDSETYKSSKTYLNPTIIYRKFQTQMQYRFLGPTGIQVSVVSFGNWLNSNSQQAKQNTIDCVKTAWDNGVNFFDTAEVYGYGEA
jgi:diketogulonate reductase-like aldo/keto reductase